jgi:hypothetical protein
LCFRHCFYTTRTKDQSQSRPIETCLKTIVSIKSSGRPDSTVNVIHSRESASLLFSSLCRNETHCFEISERGTRDLIAPIPLKVTIIAALEQNQTLNLNLDYSNRTRKSTHAVQFG